MRVNEGGYPSFLLVHLNRAIIGGNTTKEETMKFTDMKLKPYLQEALKEIKFVQPTEVQEKLIPVVMPVS